MTRWMMLAALVTLAGCSAGPEMKLKCDGTVSGGFASTFARCTGFDQLYRQNQDSFTLNLAYEEGSATPGLEYAVNVTTTGRGEPRTDRPIEPECNVTVTQGAKKWIATRGVTGVTSGTCTLRYSEVVSWQQTGNTITYCILRGRLDAQLGEDPPKVDSVNVNLRVDFDYAPSVEGDDAEKQRALCPTPM